VDEESAPVGECSEPAPAGSVTVTGLDEARVVAVAAAALPTVEHRARSTPKNRIRKSDASRKPFPFADTRGGNRRRAGEAVTGGGTG